MFDLFGVFYWKSFFSAFLFRIVTPFTFPNLLEVTYLRKLTFLLAIDIGYLRHASKANFECPCVQMGVPCVGVSLKIWSTHFLDGCL